MKLSKKELQEKKAELVKTAKEHIKKFGHDAIVMQLSSQCQKIDFQLRELN